MKERRGPSSGYDFPEKAKYRTDVWNALLDKCDPRDQTALILPSREGLEIPILLDRGVKEENIVAVDSNPAILASAPWRKQYPAVRVYGTMLGRACRRIAADGIKITVANLDLCNNYSIELVKELQSISESGALVNDASVALTMLKGRETRTMSFLMGNRMPKNFNDNGLEERLAVAFHEMSPSFTSLASGKYKSQTQCMIWAAVRMRPTSWEPDIREMWRHFIDECSEVNALSDIDYEFRVWQRAPEDYRPAYQKKLESARNQAIEAVRLALEKWREEHGAKCVRDLPIPEWLGRILHGAERRYPDRCDLHSFKYQLRSYEREKARIKI